MIKITPITTLFFFFLFLKIVWFESQNKEHCEEHGTALGQLFLPHESTSLNELFLRPCAIFRITKKAGLPIATNKLLYLVFFMFLHLE